MTDNKWICVHLPELSYPDVLEIQLDLANARKNGSIPAEVILFVEHPPVFTLGRRGGRENLVVSETFLEKAGVSVEQTGRGGNITYHGPGQLVVYPIVHLKTIGMGVVDFVTCLEEVMIRTTVEWLIKTERNPLTRGLWAGDKKLGSIGLAVRKGVTFHGLALNVNTDLKHFDWIRPCGLPDTGMTSMEELLSEKIPMDRVRDAVDRQICDIFKTKLEPVEFSELSRILKNRLYSKNSPQSRKVR